MRKRACDNPLTPVQQIYNTEAATLTSSGLDFVTNIPRFHSMKHGLYNLRHLQLPNMPTRREDIVFEDDYVKTLDGKNGLASDDGKIIGFATNKMKISVYCVRRTTCNMTAPSRRHRNCSTSRTHSNTLHVTLGSGDTEETVPVAYAVLPDKRKETYRNFFTKIHFKYNDFGLEFNPQKIRLDFESAPICVIEELYPTCRLSGCNFHFNQCMWRNVQNIGLSVQYAQADSAVREHVHASGSCIGTPPSSRYPRGMVSAHGRVPYRRTPAVGEFQ